MSQNPPRVSDPTPAQAYQERLQDRQQQQSKYAHIDVVIGWLRLFIVACGLGVGYSIQQDVLRSAWLLAPIAAFAAAMVAHKRNHDRLTRAQRSVSFYQEGLLRLAHQWSGRGVQGQRFLDAAHPYAADLDLFGEGSLFELLCTARSRVGEDRLASWLLQPAPPQVVRWRQESVAELRPRLDLREDLAGISGQRSALDADLLNAWVSSPPLPTPTWVRLVSFMLGTITTIAMLRWAITFDPLPFVPLLLLSQAFAQIVGGTVSQVVGSIDKPRHDLRLLAQYLARLETEAWTAPLLRDLGHHLRDRPSRHIARLQTMVEFMESRRNLFFKPFDISALWTLQWALPIEMWRQRHGAELQKWLQVIGEFEALCSLASHAFEHPQEPFADIEEGSVCFDGQGLRHPLLPGCVPNQVRLDEQLRLVLLSGSNMSGKSTLLRTVGTNAIMALAGATVAAARLRISPLQIGASIRVTDSLQQGISHFYAEIRRLRQMMDLAAAPPPLLFLLDEILHGTNSHDRSIGAEAVVRSLFARGAVGIVTTHDLALTAIPDSMDGHATNLHFEDQLVEGKMTFDFHLRDGVVTKSNAIELMRAVGLEV